MNIIYIYIYKDHLLIKLLIPILAYSKKKKKKGKE